MTKVEIVTDSRIKPGELYIASFGNIHIKQEIIKDKIIVRASYPMAKFLKVINIGKNNKEGVR
jgi:hypothetical protein